MTASYGASSNSNISKNSQGIGIIEKDKDNSIQIVSRPVNGSQLKVEVFLNGIEVHTDTLIAKDRSYNRQALSNAHVTFGGQTHINEIAVFERVLNSDEIKSMREYFETKYKVKE
ncbi:hypothetical protein [Streptococcus sp. X16XC17]|uniref:hypothetical protein n=1 Tax=Streptococcus sp. X16XC17 TaxID=2316646 RepID=UPI00103DDE1D|nr:hypothetical protein [Streptococcus sp. X16XC17]